MTQEQQLVLIVRGTIAQMPMEQQEKVMACYAEIKSLVAEAGEEGAMAFALFVAEMAAEK